MIAHVLASLDDTVAKNLCVTTFGCAIDEKTRPARYTQTIGLIDPLGAINSWGNRPERTPLATHSTNTRLPLSMDVGNLLRAR